PGEVQQVRWTQRRDQSGRRFSALQVEFVPRDTVRSDPLAGAAHRVDIKSVPNQRRRAMAPKEARATRSENRCSLLRIGHGQEVPLNRLLLWLAAPTRRVSIIV